MSKVRRIYVEKKEPYAVAARQLKEDILGFLAVKGLTGVRKLIRYDVENVSDEVFETACKTVFSEPPVDILYRETIDVPKDGFVFSVEALPGQFDQRADSAVQCVQFLNENENPVIKTAETYILTGTFTEDEIDRIKKYCINPVDSRETGMEKPATLQTEYPQADDVQVLTGMTTMYEDELTRLYKSLGLAMTYNCSSRSILQIQSTEIPRSQKAVFLTPIGPITAATRPSRRSFATSSSRTASIGTLSSPPT